MVCTIELGRLSPFRLWFRYGSLNRGCLRRELLWWLSKFGRFFMLLSISISWWEVAKGARFLLSPILNTLTNVFYRSAGGTLVAAASVTSTTGAKADDKVHGSVDFGPGKS